MSNTFSHTGIETFKRCPRQYQFEYIDKVEAPKRVSAEILTGQILHRCVERIYNLAANSRVLSLEETLVDYDSHWRELSDYTVEVSDPALTIDDYAATGRSALEKFHQRYAPFADATESLTIEEFVSAPLDPLGRIRMRGKLDRLRLRPDGVAEIIDYKFMRNAPRESDLARSQQLVLYYLAARDGWPRIERIEARLVLLRQDTDLRIVMDPNIVEEVRLEILQRIGEIQEAERLNAFPTKEGRYCGWCRFNSFCPAKRQPRAFEEKDTTPTVADAAALADEFIDLKTQENVLTGKLKGLRDTILTLSREMKWSKFAGAKGELQITDHVIEEFPTKSVDKGAWLEISGILDDAEIIVYSEVNTNALYKDYRDGNLPAEVTEKLSHLVRTKRAVRLDIKRKKSVGEDEGEGGREDNATD